MHVIPRLYRWKELIGAILLTSFAMIVAVSTTTMSRRGFLSLPLFDDWSMLDTNNLWQHLFEPHNEHRVVTIKLVFLADLQLFHGSHEIFFWISIALLLSVGGAYWKLADPHLFHAHRFVAAAIIICFCISPLTLGILLWAMQLQNTAACCLAILSFATLASCWNEKGKNQTAHRARVITALTLAASASLSSGTGAPAPVLLLLLAAFMRLRKSDLWLIGLGAAFSVGIFLYGNSAQDHALSTVTSSAFAMPRFFFSFLGSIIAQAVTLSDAMEYQAAALLLGAASVALLGANAFVFVRDYRAGIRNTFALFTLTTGLFLFTVAGLVTLGRLPFGLSFAFTEHYNLLRVLYWSNLLISVPACWKTERAWQVASAVGLIGGIVMALHLPARAKALEYRRLSLNVSSAAVMAEVFEPGAWERNNRWNNLDLAHEQYAALQTARLRNAQLSVFHSPIAKWMARDVKLLPTLGRPCPGSILTSTRGTDQKGFYTKVTGLVSSGQDTGKFPELILANSRGIVTGFGAISVQGNEQEWIGYSRSKEPPTDAYLFRGGQFCRLKGEAGSVAIPHIEEDPQGSNLVHDPSFETGVEWTFTGSPSFFTGRISNGSAYHNPPAPDGVLAVAVQQLGAFSQLIQKLRPGKQYQLRFYAAGRASEAGASGNQSIAVFLDGSKAAEVRVTSGQGYELSMIPFRATRPQMLLKFKGLATTDETAFIDHVAITEKPVH